jgi:hypothetical protein
MRPFPLAWQRTVAQKGPEAEPPPRIFRQVNVLAYSSKEAEAHTVQDRTVRWCRSFSPSRTGMAAPRRHHDKMQPGVVGSHRLLEQAPPLVIQSPARPPQGEGVSAAATGMSRQVHAARR